VDFATNPLDGVQIAYRRFGTGPVVVLVHGTALSQVIWRGFGYVRDLSVDHTVLTLDLRGHGRSGKPHQESAYDLELFVADVLAVLDASEVEQADYLGYSLGGRVGFSLADAHPGRVRSLISAAGAPGNRPGAFDRLFFPGCIEVLETTGMTGFLADWQAHTGEKLDSATRAALAANDARALAAYMRRSERDSGVPESRLVGLTVPMFLVVGSEDRERLTAAQKVRERVPTAVVRVIPGATHADVLRHPETATSIRGFLDRGDGLRRD
jgi:pimeloyl-ACP methyl ester carboxylesterase